ncbi:hypothetical protein CLV87_1581 [Pelagimonas phthalicica]|nr:hypothetical protein CLV87_1581 [Pelagimonas phthalicica]
MVAAAVSADPLRVATWHGDFSRKGPGLLVRELAGDKPVPGVASIAQARPDILLLTNFDFDAGHVALGALQSRLRDQSWPMPHLFALRPNTGLPTGVDVDGDGKLGGPRDAQGFGYFSGQGGQAILSRYPVRLVADHSGAFWADAPGSLIAKDDPVGAAQRLSSSAHWAVEVEVDGAKVTLLTLAATPPVFDGPEDRNGRRNRDEVLYWSHVLHDKAAFADAPVVVLGNFNLDPDRGQGLHEAVAQVLAHDRLQDPLPKVPTVKWERAGEMRISYILPDQSLRIGKAEVMPPEPKAGPHRLVWMDLLLD